MGWHPLSASLRPGPPVRSHQLCMEWELRRTQRCALRTHCLTYKDPCKMKMQGLVSNLLGISGQQEESQDHTHGAGPEATHVSLQGGTCPSPEEG